MQLLKMNSDGSDQQLSEVNEAFQSVQAQIDYGVAQSAGEKLVVMGVNLHLPLQPREEPPSGPTSEYALFACNGMLIATNIA